MRYKSKKISAITVFLLLCIIFTGLVKPLQTSAGDSYLYTLYDEAIPAPEAYVWAQSIRTADLGIDQIVSITDMFYKNDKIYIAMSGMIVITDNELNTLQTITSYINDNGEEIAISAPKCVFVTDDNEIYIAEQDRGVVVNLSGDGSFIREIGGPSTETLSNVKYAPTKVVVDDTGRIYVKAKSVYEGIIELDPDGNFNRFVGANEVVPDFFDRIKRFFATDEQIARMDLWLPTDYSDIALDKDGFILATVRDITVSNPIRKLNAAGSDILTTYEFLSYPAGDSVGNGSTSLLTTIAAADDGRFAVIDSTRSRIFVYSEDCLLAYVFGGTGKTEGSLNSPTDVLFVNDKIMVADLVSCSIEVFEPTEYGVLINAGMYAQTQYDYEAAASYFEQVKEINPDSLVASMGLGKYYLRSENFEEAMSNFKETGERTNYSAAYERIREQFLEEYFGWIILGIIILIILIAVIKKVISYYSKKGVFENNRFIKVLRKIRYEMFTFPGYILSHPFKAFDDMKYLGSGSLGFSFIIMIAFAWVALVKWQYTGFMSNMHDLDNINVPLILVSSVVPYLLFIVANWAVGVLMDGKANLKLIFKVNMYALYPSIYLYLLGVIVSQVILYNETAFVSFLYIAPIVIYVFYTFIGLIMTHQFGFLKAIVSVLLSFVGMAILIFIIVLLLTLLSGVFNDIGTIFDEILIYL